MEINQNNFLNNLAPYINDQRLKAAKTKALTESTL